MSQVLPEFVNKIVNKVTSNNKPATSNNKPGTSNNKPPAPTANTNQPGGDTNNTGLENDFEDELDELEVND